MVTSVLPYTADTAGKRQALGSPRNATPRNSKPLSNASVLSSMSRMTRIRSPICRQTQVGALKQAKASAAAEEGHSGSNSYLVLWGVVALRVVAVDLSVMEQVVVHQVPAPALVVAAEQGHVSLALHGRPLGGDAYHRHRSQRTFPPDLPRVSPFREADFPACAVRALGDGVAMESEAVLLHVNVARAVYGAQTVLEGLQLQETTQERQFTHNQNKEQVNGVFLQQQLLHTENLDFDLDFLTF